ncbi:hypothetical protein RHO15_08060 [Utexia brackfieldae]|uniref:hypothetical protein n=1 Tax=Utexia brackfieldae TaxID=3074108 RepID=UPI00370D93D8
MKQLKKYIIALRAVYNSGKTTTLKLLINELRKIDQEIDSNQNIGRKNLSFLILMVS